MFVLLSDWEAWEGVGQVCYKMAVFMVNLRMSSTANGARGHVAHRYRRNPWLPRVHE